MSEPMTTVEIEDVLSSIRRLVSEDLRPTHKLVSAALQQGASKLILTPALRIVSDVRTALPERGDGFEDAPELAVVLQDLEAEEDPGMPLNVPMFGSVRQIDTSELQNAEAQAGAAPDDANFLATAMSRIKGLARSEDDEAQHGNSDTIEAVVAAVGAAVGPEEWEPDGGEPAPQSPVWGESVWTNVEAGEDVTAEVQDDVAPAIEEPIIEVAEVSVDVEPLSVLVLETEDDKVELLSQDSIVFNDSADAVPVQEVAAEDDDEADDASDFLSEDVLREIVRDMIREELQGNLGERITRNVRKLVRAEINRALASRDFDDVANLR